MDFVKWIQEEFAAIPWILLGIIMLIGGMFVSDIATKTRDSIFKKDQR